MLDVQSKKMKVAVLGAGPTGLSAALHLLRDDPSIDLDVFEASDAVGGFSRSFELFGHIVDLGPHRFYTRDQSILQFWLSLAKKDCHVVSRQTSIFYENSFIKYPLSAADLMFALPLSVKSRIFASFLRRRKYKGVDGDNFASTMRYRFGDELYEIFFKRYTEKLWGVGDTELSATVAYQRIGNFGLGTAITHALQKTAKKVDDTFFYPTLGCGQIWEKAADEIQRRGARVLLSHPVESLVKTAKGFRLGYGAHVSEYDQVISTVPVSRLVQMYQQSPTSLKEAVRGLKFRSTVLAYVEVFGESTFDEQWVYINSCGMKTGRITNFSNWGIAINDTQDSHVVCLEYWCDMGDETWSLADEKWNQIAKKDLIKFGVEEKNIGRQEVVRLPQTYPIITNEAEATLSQLSQFFSTQENFQTIGRGGAFKYNNQDHCIEMGIRAAKKVLGEDTCTWEVNSSRQYLEAALAQRDIPPG